MTLTDLRAQVDQLDQKILKLLKERFECCMQMTVLKDKVVDPGREEELKNMWKEEARTLGLSEEFALELLSIFLQESKRLQNAA
jgi:chorismate mutase